MRYEGIVYRPPSEARSLIIQVTIGCAHNKCTFCNMYKDKRFRIRKLDDIFEDFQIARETYSKVTRIFLADGDALVLKMEFLEKIFTYIKQLFPECQRVGIYAAPKDILRKSVDELKTLRELGLKIIYLGLESGSDNILGEIKKGATAKEMIEAAKKVKEAGIKLSVTLISGLGGKEKWQEHAIDSARVLSEMDPDYLGLLTLLVEQGTEMYESVNSGELELLSPREIMMETKMLIKNLNLTNCIFRSNHASNYVALGGTFPQDKERLIKELDEALEENYDYKDDLYRRL